MRRGRRGLFASIAALFVFLCQDPVEAQGPEADWRTVTTEHYRIHYPLPFEAWALHVASTIESVRARVAQTVGFAPDEIIDVVVADPTAEANGFAYPFSGTARIVLWTTPPGSALRSNAPWSEILVTHEQAHLAHLLRPSRNPWRRTLNRVLPFDIGPVSLAPRWVSEGYATVIEGELTGAGRPFADFRAAVLRKWAVEGTLPNYQQLGSDSSSWMGMSMAYLAGSAYLEWLSERAGPGSLQKLWRRMSARKTRSFDEAFTGVFGASPKVLYGRFSAELTEKSVRAQRELMPLREGELWQDLSWSTEPPAVSPDGLRVATIIRHRKDDPQVVIWRTTADLKAQSEYDSRLSEVLARDSEDVAPVSTGPLPRKREFTMTLPRQESPSDLSWSGDGKSVFFHRSAPDWDGVLHRDLYRWRFRDEQVDRISEKADLREFHPAPAGGWGIAVRSRFGFTELVRVELPRVSVTPLTEPSLAAISGPRLNPDATLVAYVAQAENDVWTLFLLDLRTGEKRAIRSNIGEIIAQPAWAADGQSLYATIGKSGSMEIWRVALDGTAGQLTRSTGASVSPAASPDGSLFFLSLQPDGLELRRLAGDLEPLAPVLVSSDLSPAIPRAAVRSIPFEAGEVSAPRRYGVGRMEALPLISGGTSSSGSIFEVGARVGDVVGRLSTVALASFGSGAAPSGGTLATRLRISRIHTELRLYSFSEEARGKARSRRTGAELSGSSRFMWSDRNVEVGASAGASEVDTFQTFDGFSAVAGARVSAVEPRGAWKFPYRMELRAGWTDIDGASLTRGRGLIAGGLQRGGASVLLTVEAGRSDGDSGVDRGFELGGLRSSLIPETVALGRVDSGPLERGVLAGNGFSRHRIDLKLPVTAGSSLFFERMRVSDEVSAGEWISFAGLEFETEGGPVPLVRLPGFRLKFGAAYIFDQPFRDETRGWFLLSWRP